MEPLQFLLPEKYQKFALLILNCPFGKVKKFLPILWRKAVFTVCVDGAANHLHTHFFSDIDSVFSEYELDFVPDFITGDFDSINKHVLEDLSARGSQIIETPDQDHTDFTKALKFVLSRSNIDSLLDSVVVLCGLPTESRFDQVFANLNTLMIASKISDKPVWFIYGESMSVLIQPGKHTINVQSGLEGDWCSLVPIGRPCTDVTTSGLKWNLEHSTLEFGSLISTSNMLDGTGLVNIETNETLLWTIGIKSCLESPFWAPSY
ncbi:predicted protein [Nematostella vectensis]|uniref:Thiamine pyrophosphokinase 1 n=1 Tax=Nematostella vectensis TaxID=45351 RepID=A7SPK3_NEMVE|nr:thiamin pyrophosphokinase 1 [Nematostella vectensis]EDO34380.1 predicted protein [Nematostella vectensis]|eukprot:XP_001626480.1 predicted protein [Nematostella vectensis]